MAALFAVGSACFALGAVPAYVSAVGDDADAVTFFVGSLCFTAAGFLQYREAGDAAAGRDGGGRGWFSWHPPDADWQAAAIQSVGTLLFNVSTFRAMTEAFRHVSTVPAWKPDALRLGGLSGLERDRVRPRPAWPVRPAARPGLVDRRLNLLGSVFFGLSAIGDYTIPTTGQLDNPAWANGGTFLGGLCFLAGALLLPAGARRNGAPVGPEPRG